ncbi:hypothetical protein AVEN_214059-1 [Araneus ventricosus]|uniref:Uncharacterized protein n=1 Tax=Araneus ventricosus TaxID=182803 RepID=A0A4Y2QYI9_ARAVE|nr:hypothetical protein AVEN_214059-1 [Araneus ventricosus]
MSQTSLQAKDDGRPNIAAKFPSLSLSVIDFSPAAHTFFVIVARPDELGKRRVFLEFGQNRPGSLSSIEFSFCNAAVAPEGTAEHNLPSEKFKSGLEMTIDSPLAVSSQLSGGGKAPVDDKTFQLLAVVF